MDASRTHLALVAPNAQQHFQEAILPQLRIEDPVLGLSKPGLLEAFENQLGISFGYNRVKTQVAIIT